MNFYFKFNLICILLLILLEKFISSWFTISLNILNHSFYLTTLFYILLLLTLFLGYRIFFKPQLRNEFYYFFFWVIYIIIFILLSLTLFQAFQPISLGIFPKDFLLNLPYLQIKIHYTTNYILYLTYKYGLVLINNSGITNPEMLSFLYKLLENPSLYEFTKDAPTLDNFYKRITIYFQISKNVFMQFANTQNDVLSWVTTFISCFKFVVFSSIMCYTIPKIILTDIPTFLLSKVFYKSYYDFAQNILQSRFILELDAEAIHDLTTSFMAWGLKHEKPLIILEEMLKYIFS